MEYAVLQSHYKKFKKEMKSEMLLLEEIFADAREPENTEYELFNNESLSNDSVLPLPIYLTRSRIKSIDSAFLKTKRKDKPEIIDITDMIGIRVLCLFNQDINEVYTYILKLFRDKHKYSLTEITIHGWQDIAYFDRVRVAFNIENEIFSPDKSPFGYKSIHFTGIIGDEKKGHRFEIQLRTLLQDVWGEMSHKIAYKQKGNYTYVNNSFHLLSRDLETNDLLLEQLKEFTKERKCLDDNLIFRIGSVFEYEPDKLPDAFLEDGLLRLEYVKYKNLVYEEWMSRDTEKIIQCEKAYLVLAEKYVQTKTLTREDPKFCYWDLMEKSFYDLSSKDKSRIKKAEHYYKSLKDSYVASFRLGQIAIYNENFVLAIRYFDNCKRIIHEGDNMIDSNIIKAHINMSIMFEKHGNEYLPSAIEEIEEAIKIINEHKAIFDNSNQKVAYRAAYNAACWFNIEYCNYNKNHEVFLNRAEAYYNILIQILEELTGDEDMATRNTYDTLAWYNYSRFLLSKKSEIDFLRQAKIYIDKMESISPAEINLKSDIILHNSHEQLINCDYELHVIKSKNIC